MTYTSSYSRRRYGARSSAPRLGRWMELRYSGSCAICRAVLPAGTRAFYDPSDRSTTCYDLACCEANGLTEQTWHGSPTSGGWVATRTEVRRRPTVLVDGEREPVVTRGAGYRANGTYFSRCEDAPCCGCCD